ncbi:hypothetical protein EV702DRAFT_1200011 [Suillus placidus]|uniref:RNase H type-1 domain-containing protein n=1 Tax=Suillus placidus TaxID=48579 RepID=A0A9P7D0L8_9AGAM|nr:hypothetical protein EV702DRAFT_1200011 [Suillus placidus]
MAQAEFVAPPRLAFQPITPAQAQKLDLRIAHIVHHYLCFPFTFHSSLLSLPVALFGFDFPSITRLNASAAVVGLQRDLNHPITAFRDMARITLADWSCMLNSCRYPLADCRRSFVHAQAHLPWAWILAQETLLHISSAVIPTDQTSLLEGHINISHILNGSPALASSFLRGALPALTRHGFTLLSHFGSWCTQRHSADFRFEVRKDLGVLLTSSAQSLRKHLPQLLLWLKSLPFLSLLIGSRDSALAVPRPLWRTQAENYILALSSLHSAPASAFSKNQPIAASDASMLPSPVSFLEPRSITAAAATPESQVTFSLIHHGTSASILHGELLGIIAAVLLSIRANPDKPCTVFTDHKNAVHLIMDVLPGALPHIWNAQPARSLYRWLFSLLHSTSPSPSLCWTAAHMGSLTPECLANDYVDRMASSAQHSAGVLAPAPLATFAMDDYTVFASNFGFIECNLSSFVISRLQHAYASDVSFRPAKALTLALYDRHLLPDFPYTQVRHRRFHDMPPWCHFGCDAFESMHHIFALCPAFMAIRRAHNMQLCDETSSLLEGKTTDSIREVFDRAAQRLFSDDAGLWPQYRTRFYVGVLPPLADIVSDARTQVGVLSPPSNVSGAVGNVGVSSPQPVSTTLEPRLLSRLAQEWHVRSIRLAGHIWGEYRRRVRALSANPSSHITRSSLDRLSYLLPDSLRDLL